VSLRPSDGAEELVGPVRVFSKGEVCWYIKGRQKGYHQLCFQVGDRGLDKELAVGDGFMRVSAQRPERALSEDLFLHPAEEPFGPDSPVLWIDIDYPPRSSWTSGTNKWLIYWFVGSMVAALCFKWAFRVNV
jgi:hypothetical protein